MTKPILIKQMLARKYLTLICAIMSAYTWHTTIAWSPVWTICRKNLRTITFLWAVEWLHACVFAYWEQWLVRYTWMHLDSLNHQIFHHWVLLSIHPPPPNKWWYVCTHSYVLTTPVWFRNHWSDQGTISSKSAQSRFVMLAVGSIIRVEPRSYIMLGCWCGWYRTLCQVAVELNRSKFIGRPHCEQHAM